MKRCKLKQEYEFIQWNGNNVEEIINFFDINITIEEFELLLNSSRDIIGITQDVMISDYIIKPSINFSSREWEIFDKEYFEEKFEII